MLQIIYEKLVTVLITCIAQALHGLSLEQASLIAETSKFQLVGPDMFGEVAGRNPRRPGFKHENRQTAFGNFFGDPTAAGSGTYHQHIVNFFSWSGHEAASLANFHQRSIPFAEANLPGWHLVQVVRLYQGLHGVLGCILQGIFHRFLHRLPDRFLNFLRPQFEIAFATNGFHDLLHYGRYGQILGNNLSYFSRRLAYRNPATFSAPNRSGGLPVGIESSRDSVHGAPVPKDDPDFPPRIQLQPTQALAAQEQGATIANDSPRMQTQIAKSSGRQLASAYFSDDPNLYSILLRSCRRRSIMRSLISGS
jgi:hypothetical protein